MRDETKHTLAILSNWELAPELRVEAATRIGALGDPDAVLPLAVLYAESDTDLRPSIATALDQLSGTEVLAADLKSPDATVRIRAAQALSLLRDPAAVPALIRGLRDPNPRVREHSASALYGFQDRRATEALIAQLFSDPDPDVRGAAAQSLGEVQGGSALEALRGAMSLEADGFTAVLIERSIVRAERRQRQAA